MTVGPTTLYEQLDDHVSLAETVRGRLAQVQAAGDELCRHIAGGGVLYSFGNGGSASQAQHLAAELAGRYQRERRGLAAVALNADTSVLTCIANDYSYEEVFARQVDAMATAGDVVVGFSTSGRSPSVLRGLRTAREHGAYTLLFTGNSAPAEVAVDLTFAVASASTARVQEMHLLLLHLLCDHIDRWAASGMPHAEWRPHAAGQRSGGRDFAGGPSTPASR